MSNWYTTERGFEVRIRYSLVTGNCRDCDQKCWSQVGGKYDFHVTGDTWRYQCQGCTDRSEGWQ